MTLRWAWKQFLAERAFRSNPSGDLCEVFRLWPDHLYADLYLSDLSGYPELSRRLPKMPSAEVQRSYGGADGALLMARSTDFVRSAKQEYERLAKRSLAAARVLDYGCGWGRLTRLFLQFVPERRMRACDAWPEGVEVFRALGFQIKCDLIDELARDLPYEDKSFEFVCAFSVLTHLPDYAAKAVMTALHRVLASDGVIAITVRPKSYWALFNDGEMVRQHEERGFAYRPHNGRAIFGDNSMSLGHIENNWSAWQIVSTQVNTTTRISA